MEILISDSSFVKLHFKRSTQNPQLALVYLTQYAETAIVSAIPLSHFLVSLSKPVTLTNDPYFCLKDKDCFSVVGSCNGLLCLYGYSDVFPNYRMTFGYDNSTDTYKVVYLHRGVRLF
ncbi:hypothetical protein MtrunA17_Chr7g0238561 [Medicago truncatula]|uniref:Uncharacterized protein n=1 Tax=Medicago truncatula TaxID=3880 RepID=A0A396H0V5_MEDTR|nr:hypothetical protein MtrunA17_Chr7g0238561 [Medicago truncatula]